MSPSAAAAIGTTGASKKGCARKIKQGYDAHVVAFQEMVRGDRAEGLGGNIRRGGSPVVVRVNRSLQGTAWGLGLRQRRAIRWGGDAEPLLSEALVRQNRGPPPHPWWLGRPCRQRLRVDEDQRRFPALKPDLMSLPRRVWRTHRYEHELGMDTDRT
jgi:hypothetical protein